MSIDVFYMRKRKPLDDLLLDVPPDALDLLHALLQFNPDKRLTAEQALKHPYVKRYIFIIFIISIKNLLYEICKYHMVCKLQTA